MRKTSILGITAIVLYGMLGMGTPAQSQTFPVEPAFPDKPSNFRYLFSCYDDRTHELLNCKVTLTVIGITDDGGHKQHPGTRPLFASVPDELICLNCADRNDDKKVVETFTFNSVVDIRYPLPEVAGGIRVEANIQPPRTHFCVSNCNPVTLLDVRVLAIVPVELAPGPDDGFALKAPTTLHPIPYFGTDKLKKGIRLVSKAYSEITGGHKLRVTDMSLPAGGMFDLCGTYNPTDTCPAAPDNGHLSHRTGIDVDFGSFDLDPNGQQGDDVDCNTFKAEEMLVAFDEAGVAGFRKCYDDGHYHLRIP